MRITCPSCSAPLSIQDEHAGRAVKCPQCGGVIPASRTEPEPPPTADPDEPPPLPASGRPTAQPTTRREDDEDGDRQRRRRRREDDDADYDDRPRPRRRGAPPQKSNSGLVLLIVFGVILLICGGVGFAVYKAVEKVQEKVQEKLDELTNPATTPKFNAITHSMSRLQVEMELGGGNVATMDELRAVFPADSTSMKKWTPKVQARRVLVWKNPKNEDRLFIAFHPNLDANGLVQMKELAGKTSGNSLTDGYVYEDDDAFVKQFGVGVPRDTTVDVTAGLLLGDYSSDRVNGDRKYKDRRVVVTDGILDKWEGKTAVVYSRTLGKTNAFRIRVDFLPNEIEMIPEFKPDDTIEFTGTCEGRTGNNIIVKKAKFD